MTINIDDLIACSIIMYHKMIRRKSVSERELENIKQNIIYYYQDNDVSFNSNCDFSSLLELVDEARVDDEIFYRLKPNLLVEVLRRKYIGSLPVKTIKILVDKKIYKGSVLYSAEDEKKFSEFQNIDEKVQLEHIKKIFLLEKELRKIKTSLKIVRRNSVNLVDIPVINEFLGQPHNKDERTLEQFYEEERPKTAKH